MSPDDPRHGLLAGYIAGCRCQDCRKASSRYEKRRTYDRQRGIRRTVPNTGFVRRVHALQANGWSLRHIATELGIPKAAVWRKMMTRPGITLRTDQKMRETFDRLSLVPGPSSSARIRALSKGYAPPLAWDDETIDDPNAKPKTDAPEDPRHIDEVVVRRILDGQPVDSTRAEREEVIRRWLADGRTINELDRLTGWNVRRDRRIIQNRSAA